MVSVEMSGGFGVPLVSGGKEDRRLGLVLLSRRRRRQQMTGVLAKVVVRGVRFTAG